MSVQNTKNGMIEIHTFLNCTFCVFASSIWCSNWKNRFSICLPIAHFRKLKKNIEHSTICIMGYFTFSSCSCCCVQVHIFQCKIRITNHFRALQFRLISAYKTMTTNMVLSLNLNTIQWIDFFSDHVLNIFHLECFFLHRRFSACSLFRVECGEKNQLKKNPYPLCYRNEREWLHSKSIFAVLCARKLGKVCETSIGGSIFGSQLWNTLLSPVSAMSAFCSCAYLMLA